MSGRICHPEGASNLSRLSCDGAPPLFRGNFGRIARFEHADKQYHRPDLTERYKTRVMRPAMREGIVDQGLARLQGRGSERERTYNHRHHPVPTPFSFFHDPTFLPNQPPSTPPRRRTILLALSSLSPSPSLSHSSSLRSLFLSTFVSRYLREPGHPFYACVSVLCTLAAGVRVVSPRVRPIERVYHRYVYLRKMPKQAHKATRRNKYECTQYWVWHPGPNYYFTRRRCIMAPETPRGELEPRASRRRLFFPLSEIIARGMSRVDLEAEPPLPRVSQRNRFRIFIRLYEGRGRVPAHGGFRARRKRSAFYPE